MINWFQAFAFSKCNLYRYSEAREGFVQRARSLLTKGCRHNPGDPPLLQALARLEAGDGNMRAARVLFEQGGAVTS